VNQLAPWIRCVFHDNNKVHRANEALKQLGFAYRCYRQVCLKQLIFTQKTNLLKRPQIRGSQNQDKRLQPIKTDY